MTITCAQTNETTDIRISESFTYANSNDYRLKLFHALNAGTRHITIHLSAISFMDSAGLGMLLVTLNECNQRGASLTLNQPMGEVKALLELTNSYERFTIRD